KGTIRKPGGTGTGLGNAPTPGNSSNGIAAPTVPPRIKRYSEPPYPSAVKSAGITGVVRLKILIDKNGNPESVSVSSSSGNGQLDQSALNTAYKWRFSPGLDSLGKPVRCYAYIPIKFAIK
ncbi:MAG: energy transducer TonB, partial [Clostridia bacterium]|nr:energy transducer TonB [Clostridia bacterium]